MQCPHCTVNMHPIWHTNHLVAFGQPTGFRVQNCICPACDKPIVEVGSYIKQDFGDGWMEWRTVVPQTTARMPVPPEVPPEIAADYTEACAVLYLSPKASAALSRRCLQNILHQNGYKGRDLAREIDLLLNDASPSKAIPETLRVAVDGIRHFGNFSAHPVTDITGLQIIDVEPDEAEWCLEILEECFQHFFVNPARAAVRKAALDEKLRSAGKPASK